MRTPSTPAPTRSQRPPAPAPVTDLADYQKKIVCKDQNGTGQVVATIGPDSSGPLDVAVGHNDDIVCVSTNTREQGKIELKKDLNPNDDPGLFDLAIKKGTTDVATKTDATDGGSTGETPVNTGTYNVSEAAGTSTDLADYQKSITCKDENGTGAVVASVGADNSSPLDVPVESGDDIVCVALNVRETGQIQLKKDLEPDNDPGLFDLAIKHGDTNVATKDDASDGEGTDKTTVNTGTYNVSEAAGTGTSLADYQKSIVCKDGGGDGDVVASIDPDSPGPLDVKVAYGDDIVCTSHNVRETGKIELKKDLNPDDDPGLFDLAIKQGATDVATKDDASDGDGTGEKTVNTGTYNVSEAAGTSTALNDYDKSITCKDQNGTRPDRRLDRPRLGRPAKR